MNVIFQVQRLRHHLHLDSAGSLDIHQKNRHWHITPRDSPDSSQPLTPPLTPAPNPQPPPPLPQLPFTLQHHPTPTPRASFFHFCDSVIRSETPVVSRADGRGWEGRGEISLRCVCQPLLAILSPTITMPIAEGPGFSEALTMTSLHHVLNEESKAVALRAFCHPVQSGPGLV